MPAERAAGHVGDEVARGIDADAARSGKGQADPAGVGAWGDDEIVLAVAALAVVDQIDAGVDAFESHAPVRGDVADPAGGVGADEVVRAAFEGIERLNPRPRVRARQADTQRGAGLEREHRLGAGEQHGETIAAGEVGVMRIGLSAILLEEQREGTG